MISHCESQFQYEKHALHFNYNLKISYQNQLKHTSLQKLLHQKITVGDSL